MFLLMDALSESRLVVIPDTERPAIKVVTAMWKDIR